MSNECRKEKKEDNKPKQVPSTFFEEILKELEMKMAVYSERVENCIHVQSLLFLVEMMVAMKFGSNNHKSLSSVAGGNEVSGSTTSEEK